MKEVLVLFSLLVLFSGCERKTPGQALEQWLGKEPAARQEMTGQKFAAVPLSKEEAAQVEELLWQDYQGIVKAESQKGWEEKCLKHRSYRFALITKCSEKSLKTGEAFIFLCMEEETQQPP